MPFMNTSLYGGYVSAHWLPGGDIAFAAGFVTGLVAYPGIRWLGSGARRDSAAAEPVAGREPAGATDG